MSSSQLSTGATLIQALRSAFLLELENIVRTLGHDRAGVVEAVREAAEQYHDELAGLRGRMGFEQTKALTASRISLVHEDELTFTLELGDLARGLRERCGTELAALHSSYAKLLSVAEIGPEQLPIGPETVCQSLRALADAASMSSEQRLRLLEDIASPLAEGLRQLYGQLNAMLVEAGIQAYRPPTTKEASPPASSAPAPNPPPAPLQDPAAALQQLLSARLPSQLPAASGTAPTALDPSLAAAILGQVRTWLAQSRQARQGEVHLSGSGLAPLLPTAVAGAVETVEQIFSLIATHPDLPARIKPILAELQIPVLLLVLDDAGAIGEPAHPARQLIDGIASFGMRLPDDRRADTEYRELADIVTSLQDAPTPDERAFALALERLQAIATLHDSACQQHTAPLIDNAARLDRREHALHAASRALARIIEPDTPSPIHDFLWTWWVQVLARTLYRLGDKHPRWREQLNAAHQLVLSGHRIHAPQERARRIELLPQLIGSLQEGLAGVGLNGGACERALAPCVDLHAAILNGQPVPGAAEQVADPLPGLNVDPTIKLRLFGIGQVLREQGRHTTEPLGITTDSLFEIRLPDESLVRASATWIGAHRQVALLFSHTDGNLLAMSLKALARLVSLQRARVLLDRGIVEQAAAQLLRRTAG